MFNDLMKTARERISKRIRYNRMVQEINGLTARDLSDMGADRGQMLYHAYRDVYGR